MGLLNLTFTTASSDQELVQILSLQEKNLPASISQTEKEIEGFVTVQHDLKMLKRMNTRQPHCIAKDGNVVIGYALSMTPEFGNDIAVLKPMFAEIKNSSFKETSYIVMGQICIDKAYRKQGVFRGLYQLMQQSVKSKFNTIITEVDALNTRSITAHAAIGFKHIKTYKSGEQNWELIYWSWK